MAMTGLKLLVTCDFLDIKYLVLYYLASAVGPVSSVAKMAKSSELGNGLKHVEVRSVFLQRRKCEEA